MIEYSGLEYAKLAIFYASWLYFPAAGFLVWAIATGRASRRFLAGGILLVLTILAYARFVEPRLLLTATHDLELKRCFADAGKVRLAVFSDTHVGLFANAMPVRRIARRVRALEPDAVLIAGDFTYWLEPRRFNETYAAFGGIGAPVFAVLGNHDVGFPGPDVGAPLSAALADIGLDMIDNARTELALGNTSVEVVGLSDAWQGKQDMGVLAQASSAPRILLTHNPNTVFDLPADASVDLLVAGHTHGGQVRIPGLTCAIFQDMCEVTLYGAAEYGSTAVFVTSGTGMVGLPMRFSIPPRIDVLNVLWNACAPA